jgi:hypothetical protein
MSSRQITFVAVSALAIASVAAPSYAHASGGERTMKALRAASRIAEAIVTRPVPLYPGSATRFNIAPVVRVTDQRTKRVIGLISASAENRATAIGGLVAFADDAGAYAGLLALGGKRAVGGAYALAGEGSAFAGFLAAAPRHAIAGAVALGGEGVGIAGGVSRGNRAFALGIAGGVEHGGAALVVGLKDGLTGELEGGYGLVNGVRAIIKEMP